MPENKLKTIASAFHEVDRGHSFRRDGQTRNFRHITIPFTLGKMLKCRFFFHEVIGKRT